jgi:hypothetical protein
MVNVQLLVYDLSRGMASSMSEAILGARIDGIWHTGVLVFNKEYFYGGGIQVAPVGVFSAGNQMYPVQTINIGETNKTKAELDSFLSSIHNRFTALTYDLLRNNCNNFSNEVCMFLTGRGIPSFIIDLPNIIFSTPGGAMLRPMIENMQRNAYQQQAHTFDPCAAAQYPAPTAFESNLSEIIQSSILHSEVVKKAQLEEEPLTSSDSSSLAVLVNKIVQLPGSDGVKGSALTSDEKLVYQALVEAITNKKSNAAVYNKQTYELLHRILDIYPSAQMSSYYLLRLIALNPLVDLSQLPTLPWTITKLLQSPDSFTSHSSLTMSLCFLLNVLSHEDGLAYVFASPNELANPILDAAMAMMSHARAEVRQMAAAIAYNYTLYNTKVLAVSSLWLKESVTSELHPTAVQLLLSSVESIGSEEDLTVRKRRLSIACRIVRTYDLLAGHLGRDLGFVESLKALQSIINKDKAGSTAHRFEEDAILELSVAFS